MIEEVSSQIEELSAQQAATKKKLNPLVKQQTAAAKAHRTAERSGTTADLDLWGPEGSYSCLKACQKEVRRLIIQQQQQERDLKQLKARRYRLNKILAVSKSVFASASTSTPRRSAPTEKRAAPTVSRPRCEERNEDLDLRPLLKQDGMMTEGGQKVKLVFSGSDPGKVTTCYTTPLTFQEMLGHANRFAILAASEPSPRTEDADADIISPPKPFKYTAAFMDHVTGTKRHKSRMQKEQRRDPTITTALEDLRSHAIHQAVTPETIKEAVSK
jgi:hypothetical protein